MGTADTASQKLLLLSDFNLGNLAGQFRAHGLSPKVDPELADYGQVQPILNDRSHAAWEGARSKSLLVWTTPERVSGGFQSLAQFGSFEMDAILNEVDSFTASIANAASEFKIVFLPLWTTYSWNRTNTHELSVQGAQYILMRMNARLIEKTSSLPNVRILNSSRWLEAVGDSAYSPRLWYMAKIPYSNDVFAEVVKDVKWHFRSALGGQRKLIICDLDDTMWGGILGDDGWENLKIGGHDPVGESFHDFQLALKSMKNRGVLLAIASKNDEKNALHAIASHPEMVLKESDFVAWRINWNDKALNIIELLKELNLGAQSAIFLDDNPVERARVREMIPEILVPELPQNKLAYVKTLLSLDCIDLATATAEDLARTDMYRSEKGRESAREQFVSAKDWLATLNMRISFKKLSKPDLGRTTQLMNKTNQLNLRTRRFTESELWDWAHQENQNVFVIRVEDRFGDLGLVGILSLKKNADEMRVEDYVLSCRVMGRSVEESILWVATQFAKSNGSKNLRAEYIPTSKNKPILDFFNRSGLSVSSSGHVFQWDLSKGEYLKPSFVDISIDIENLHSPKASE